MRVRVGCGSPVPGDLGPAAGWGIDWPPGPSTDGVSVMLQLEHL